MYPLLSFLNLSSLLRVVDEQVHVTVLAILAGVAVNMGALADRLTGGIDSLTHQPVPQQSGKVVGPGLKSAVLQEAVVRGCQGDLLRSLQRNTPFRQQYA